MFNAVRHVPDSQYLFLDDGRVLKVVSIPKENWETEEIILEELSVFQVIGIGHTFLTQCFPQVSPRLRVTCYVIFSYRLPLVTLPANHSFPNRNNLSQEKTDLRVSQVP